MFAYEISTNQNENMDIKDIRRSRLKQWFSNRSIPEKEKSYLSQLMGGKASFGEKAARRLEQTYEMGMGYLDTSSDDAPRSLTKETTVSSEYVSFDPLNTEVKAGDESGTRDFAEIIRRVDVLKSWASTALGGDLSRIKLISACGTSMQGTIENGDVLFVDASIRTYDGDGIYVISRSGEVQVKRLQKLHGGVLAIISDNRAYEAERLSSEDADTVVICGRVLAAWPLKKFW